MTDRLVAERSKMGINEISNAQSIDSLGSPCRLKKVSGAENDQFFREFLKINNKSARMIILQRME